MSAASAKLPNKWAILIGIDRYVCDDAKVRYDTDDKEIELKDLQGCVNDALAVEEYLIKETHIQPENIRKLLAPLPDRELNSLGEYLEPTYANILKALKAPSKAKAGDLVYFHYSGHGLRATTVFKELDETRRYDEVLVPSNFPKDGCYLPDLELGMLLQTMEDAGLIVTAVLDCCHSGGAVRSAEEPHLGATRSLPSIYKSDPKQNRPQKFARIKHFSHRVLLSKLRRDGHFVLAACQDTEEAKETYTGGRWHGLLTHSLLKTLRRNRRDVFSHSIYEDVFFEVRRRNRKQTPDFVGSKDRFFFSKEIRQRGHALHFRVQKASLDPRKARCDQLLQMGGGDIHGIMDGSEFAILPRGFDLTQSLRNEDVLARAKVINVDTTECSATITEMCESRKKEIEEGCLAVLVNQPITTKFSVKLDGSLTLEKKTAFEQQWQQVQGVDTWLDLRSDRDDDEIDFIISIDENGHFEIQDRSSSFTSLHQQTTDELSSDDDIEEHIESLIRRLQHLARFVMTKKLSNTNVQLLETPKLVSVKIEAASEAMTAKLKGVKSGKLEEKVPGLFESEEKTLLCMTIKNQTSHDLGVVILNCGAELSVHQMWPNEKPFKRIDKGKAEKALIVLEIEGVLRAGAKNGAEIIDTLKVFACRMENMRSLDALSLPDLWTQEQEYGTGRGNGLENGHLGDLLGYLDNNRKGKSIDVDPVYWETTDIRVKCSPSTK